MKHNNLWDYEKLIFASGLIAVEAERLEYVASNNVITNDERPAQTAEILRHALEFIEYYIAIAKAEGRAA